MSVRYFIPTIHIYNDGALSFSGQERHNPRTSWCVLPSTVASCACHQGQLRSMLLFEPDYMPCLWQVVGWCSGNHVDFGGRDARLESWVYFLQTSDFLSVKWSLWGLDMIQINHLPGKPFARCVEVLVLHFWGSMSWVETIPAPSLKRLSCIKQSLDVYQIGCMCGTFSFLECLYLPNPDQDGLG